MSTQDGKKSSALRMILIIGFVIGIICLIANIALRINKQKPVDPPIPGTATNSTAAPSNSNNKPTGRKPARRTSGTTIPMVKVDSIAGNDVKSFWIGITEITQEQWRIVKNIPKNQTRHNSGRTDKHPMENITWGRCGVIL